MAPERIFCFHRGETQIRVHYWAQKKNPFFHSNYIIGVLQFFIKSKCKTNSDQHNTDQ